MVACVVIPASALLSDLWPLRGMPAQAGYRPADASRGGSGAGGQGESGSERLVRMRRTVIRLRPSPRADVTAATPMVTP